MTGFYLDDFFRFDDKTEFDRCSETVPAPASLSVDEIKELHEEMIADPKRLSLSIVLYTNLLFPAIKPYMRFVDQVSLWIWDGCDINQIEENFLKYRELVPDKPTLLGIYMWDFGGKQELSVELMKKQLDFAYELFMANQIDGLIFHCTPLCNKNLAAVNYARDWIQKNGDTIRT
jgi:hypothetical protein